MVLYRAPAGIDIWMSVFTQKSITTIPFVVSVSRLALHQFPCKWTLQVIVAVYSCVTQTMESSQTPTNK